MALIRLDDDLFCSNYFTIMSEWDPYFDEMYIGTRTTHIYSPTFLYPSFIILVIGTQKLTISVTHPDLSLDLIKRVMIVIKSNA